MIKQLFLYILIALGFMTVSCGDSEVALFEMRLEADFSIPAGLNSFDTHYFYIRDVPTRIRNYINSDVDTSAISSIQPTQAILDARFLAIDWAIIREISVRVVSQDETVNKEVFYHDRIGLNNVKEVQLLSSLPDVKDILLEDNLTLEVRLNFIQSTPAEIESRLTMNFAVNGPT